MGIILPRIMYAVRETRRLLPCYFRMESSLDLVSLSLVLDAADYPVLHLLHVIYAKNGQHIAAPQKSLREMTNVQLVAVWSV